MKTENAWEKYTKTQLEEVDALSKAYRAFLNHGKTERECVKQIVERAKEAGYKELSELIKEGKDPVSRVIKYMQSIWKRPSFCSRSAVSLWKTE